MNCRNCSKKIEEDSKFCQFCGEKAVKTDDPKVEDVEKEVIDHLEFMGYEVNKLEINGGSQRYSAIHKSRPNLIFSAITNIGISFASFYNIDDEKVRKHRDEALEVINRMNNQGLFCSFSLSPDLKSFVCGALYLGKYNKKQFADFIDLFESDVQGRLKAEDYLKDFT